METLTLTIDGKKVKARKGMTVLEAALGAGIYIPNLCHHPDLNSFGACRLCIVHIDGIRGLPTACTTMAEDRMIIRIDSPEIRKVRRVALELLIASHPADCLTCDKDLDCELQILAVYLGLTDQRFKKEIELKPLDLRNPLFVRDPNKCVLCGRCVRICQDVRGVGAISFVNRGKETLIDTAFNHTLAEAECRFCSACVEVCPTGALTDRNANWKTVAEREEALLPCKHACPAGVDIPRYVRYIADGKFGEATAVIREKAPFPRILGRICTHPCEDVCQREQLNEPISIRSLKRFAADHDNGLWKKSLKISSPTGKKVAVIGSGPAGLTAAYFLKKLGHFVTVFEAHPESGGMMRMGIPEFRLPRDVVDAEINEVERIGVEIKTNNRIESLFTLIKDGYDAIFIAVGAHKSVRLGVEGEDFNGIMDCITFLRDISLGKEVILGNNVAVIGGGNAAIDAARTALRKSAKVTIIYRRTRNEMPASKEEVEEAIKEGVKTLFLATPSKIRSKDGKLKLECIRMKLGEPDATGRRRPVPVQGSEFTMEFDTIITAIGQVPDIPGEYELKLDRGNKIKVNLRTMRTNRKNVFAGGDAVSGPATVIEAITSGRKAAEAIDKYLGGKGMIDKPLIPLEEENNFLGRLSGFASLKRENIQTISLKRRYNSFAEVELGFNKETAIKEATRCLRCNLRLKISPMVTPQIKSRRMKSIS